MDCNEKYFEWMNRAIDGDLDGVELAELEAHLTACSACRSLYEALRRMAVEAAALEVEPPTDLSEKVMGRVRAARRRSPVRILRWTLSLAGTAAVLVTVFLGGRLILHGAGNSKAEATVYSGDAYDDAAPESAYAMEGAAQDNSGMTDDNAPRDPAPDADEESTFGELEEEQSAEGNAASNSVGMSAKARLRSYGINEGEYRYILILLELPEELEGRDYDTGWDGSRLYTLSNAFAESLMDSSSQYVDQENTAAQSLAIWDKETP